MTSERDCGIRHVRSSTGMWAQIYVSTYTKGLASKGAVTIKTGGRRVRMARWLLAVETNCADPSRETEFAEWYDNTHLQDVLEPPGILTGARYENLDPSAGRGKFLALYEIESDNIEETTAAFWANVNTLYERGRMTDVLQPVSISTYKQMAHIVKQ